MISNDKEIIQAADIVAIIGEYVDLKRSGKDYKGCCPFHAEKTPSFSVSPSKQMYHCFGCGKSGDVAKFVQDIKSVTYPEALRELSNRVKVEVVETASAISAEVRDLQDRLFAANEAAIGAFFKITKEDFSSGGRTWSAATASSFRLCEHGDRLPDSIPVDDLKAAGWLGESESGVYATFKNRLLLPVFTENGRIAGVTARDLTGKAKAKYLHTANNEVFERSLLLYGLFQNKNDIRKTGRGYLVEGPTDVLSLADACIPAVAALGKSITTSQATVMARMASHWVILADGDANGAGEQGAISSAMHLISRGCAVDVCLFPEGEDPDSFVRNHGARATQAYLDSSQVRDAVEWLILRQLSPDDMRSRDLCIREAVHVLSLINDPITRKNYIRQLCTRDKLGHGISRELGNAIQDAINARTKQPESDDTMDAADATIREVDNTYRMDNGQMQYAISNFVIKPIMLVIGAQRSERIFEIVNFRNRRTLVAISTDDFVEISTFKKAVERYGNYIFWGGPKDFTRLREYIYAQTPECHPISMLGQHRQGFWAWANGLSIDGQFAPVNEYGVVRHGDHSFYLPMCSSLGADILADDNAEDYEAMKLFSYKVSQVSVGGWANAVREVHGDSALLAVPWTIASVFYDIVFKKNRYFPHLNLFGPPGSGKNYMATSLLSVFGQPRKPFGLAQGSDAAFFRSLSQYKNAAIWFDEYSNNIDRNRADAIKNAYDGTDRVIGKKSNDNRTVTQKVTSAVILSGQDQPTFDIAMFERCLAISFRVLTYTETQLRAARALKVREESGEFSQVAHLIHGQRDHFDAAYEKAYTEVRETFSALIQSAWPDNQRRPKERYVGNYLVPLVAYYILQEPLGLPYKLSEVMDAMLTMLIDQTSNIYSEDDVSRFWDIFRYCSEHPNLLTADDDYRVRIGPTFTIKVREGTKRKTATAQVAPDERILFIRMEKLFPEYQERHQRLYRRNSLNKNALIHYLSTTDGYVGSTQLYVDGAPKQYLAFRVAELPFTMRVTETGGVDSAMDAIAQEHAMTQASADTIPF